MNTLFTRLVGTLALAVGLALGLDGREPAGRVWESWYAQGQQAEPTMACAAYAAKQRAQR